MSGVLKHNIPTPNNSSLLLLSLSLLSTGGIVFFCKEKSRSDYDQKPFKFGCIIAKVLRDVLKSNLSGCHEGITDNAEFQDSWRQLLVKNVFFLSNKSDINASIFEGVRLTLKKKELRSFEN